MDRICLRIKETIATLIAKEKYYQLAEEEVKIQRKYLENYILYDQYFSTALSPYEVEQDAPEIIQQMARVSQITGVGPMAAVAGAIAYNVVKALVEAGARHVIFDNGGDIALYIEEPATIGIYSGENYNNQIGFLVQPRDEIFGICTSSATVGHSISFGNTDSTTVVSSDVILADATATALGNDISSENVNILGSTMEKRLVDGIEGLVVVADEKIGFCGKLPQIIRAKVNYDLISKG